jgi:hypothetical protein
MKTKVFAIIVSGLVTLGAYCQDPFIQNCISQVNADSIRATLEQLQAFGTRYAVADNRKEVASWIAGRFLQYGYTDVKLDSFQSMVNYPGVGDSLIWQYNVVCSEPGKNAPGEVCIMGGHYDSYCDGDPYTLAPGVDDNGSAVAATLETARVMKQIGLQQESTIRFILFAAEEIGFLGSIHQAGTSAGNHEDIRLVFNMDMIAFNPDNLDTVYLFRYQHAECAFNIADKTFREYTDLSVLTGPPEFEARSDSYTYWNYGYPATWAFEYDFNDFYHSEADILANCNTGYCTEIARGAFATILEMQFRPFPPGVAAESSPENITVSWRPTENGRASGYNIYRSDNDSTGFLPLNTTLITDTLFIDESIDAGRDYYYYVTLVNDSLLESAASNVVNGARFGFTDSLLVVACLKGTQTTPDSTLQFYEAVLDSIPYRWFDMNQENPLTLGTLAGYRNTLWIVNSFDYDKITDAASDALKTFLDNGGNMMFAGFSFSRFMNGNIGYPFRHPDFSLSRRYFKLDSAYKTISSLMYRAYPDEAGYDTLRIDSLKTNKPGFPGELYNIEVYVPADSGMPIYRFDSHYDPGTTQGSQQDQIVGLEYLGQDYKTILLSFPLLYIDTNEARKLMKYVVYNRFGNPTGFFQMTNDKLQITNYPNPASSTVTLSFTLKDPSLATIRICRITGQTLSVESLPFLHMGKNEVKMNVANLPPGIYIYSITTGSGDFGSGKLVKY